MNSLRHIARLFAIARTLARHDALFILQTLGIHPFVVTLAGLLGRRRTKGRPGQRLAAALQEMGPSFIKLGQMLATRPDLLGEEMSADLSHLQDRLPPFPADEARAAIEKELGKPVSELFESFDDTAIAAASIAQVHFAATPGGEEVAVKVLRPGIEKAFTRDLDLFFWAAHLVERARPQFRRLKPVEVVATLAQSVRMEMDLRFEAAAAAELAVNFEGDDTFEVAPVDWTRTAQRVLTTGRIHGVPLLDAQTVRAAGHDPLIILER
ncbi:MAG: 2-polyprenylphenol 6-hydroxylase, partial [Rhodospirillaceae bacterium]|nr:2-polyprenylphenol 6-hydroxylase [Rhodospirillaceae bacterium]